MGLTTSTATKLWSCDRLRPRVTQDQSSRKIAVVFLWAHISDGFLVSAVTRGAFLVHTRSTTRGTCKLQGAQGWEQQVDSSLETHSNLGRVV